MASAGLAMEDGGFLEAIVRREVLSADAIVTMAAMQLGLPLADPSTQEEP